MTENILTENKGTKKKEIGFLSSFALHSMALVFMTCDHLWGTDFLGEYTWLTWIGRLTFPIFAFLNAEGYAHTSNLKKYIKRLLIFALIAEIPYNLMTESSAIYPFGQNVLWTFILSLLCMKAYDSAREKSKKPIVGYLLGALVVLGFYLLATVTMVDYMGDGLLMAVTFHVFRGDKWYHKLLQIAAILYINLEMMKGLVYPIELFGNTFEIPEQGFAIFALIPIMLYSGKQGFHNKFTRYFFYIYYPAHMLLLSLIKMAL